MKILMTEYEIIFLWNSVDSILGRGNCAFLTKRLCIIEHLDPQGNWKPNNFPGPMVP